MVVQTLNSEAKMLGVPILAFPLHDFVTLVGLTPLDPFFYM